MVGDKTKVCKFKVTLGRDSSRKELYSSPSSSSFETVPSGQELLALSSMWDQPFDVGMVRANYLHEIFQAAPFLYGRSNASYIPAFFKRTLGLCNSSILFSKLSSSELLPLEDLEAVYLIVNGRHPVRLIPKEARESPGIVLAALRI